MVIRYVLFTLDREKWDRIIVRYILNVNIFWENWSMNCAKYLFLVCFSSKNYFNKVLHYGHNIRSNRWNENHIILKKFLCVQSKRLRNVRNLLFQLLQNVAVYSSFPSGDSLQFCLRNAQCIIIYLCNCFTIRSIILYCIRN